MRQSSYQTAWRRAVRSLKTKAPPANEYYKRKYLMGIDF